jgi:HTH-type transcriptional regulator/antitoxin HigA
MSAHAKQAFDKAEYGRILTDELPRPIRSDQELARAIRRLEKLDFNHAELSAEEREMAELYTTLIEAYENQHYPVPHAVPHKFLEALLEQRGLAQADIAPLVGGRGRASEILNGKRSISKAQARKLADFFRVSVESFI